MAPDSSVADDDVVVLSFSATGNPIDCGARLVKHDCLTIAQGALPTIAPDPLPALG